MLRPALFFALVALVLPLRSSAQTSFKPPEGFVPDAETAIKIAVAVWEPIYGKEQIAAERPYRATLADGVWTVTGSLPKGFTRGGVAETRISKEDGRTLGVIHGK